MDEKAEPGREKAGDMGDNIGRQSRTTGNNYRIKMLFQQLELIVKQYHALWQDQLEIHYPSGLVIATLRALVAAGEEGVGLAQNAIASDLRQSPVLVTRLMKEMEAAGLVERGLGKFDQRQRAVRITPKGRSHLSAFEGLKASIGDGIFTFGTAESWEDFADCLGHISAVLKRLDERRRSGTYPVPPPSDGGGGRGDD